MISSALDPVTKKPVVWQNTLDKLYHCLVVREERNQGTLIMRDPEGKELLRKEVVLMYNAQYGPDVADVALWATLVLAKADELKQ